MHNMRFRDKRRLGHDRENVRSFLLGASLDLKRQQGERLYATEASPKMLRTVARPALVKSLKDLLLACVAVLVIVMAHVMVTYDRMQQALDPLKHPG